MTALDATVQADRAALENARAALAASRAAIENARAAARADEALADSARLPLGYTSIRSPLDGRMGRAEVRVGALVGKGDATLLATVSTIDPMYVSFSVSEREALSVWNRRRAENQAKPGSGITITLPDDSGCRARTPSSSWSSRRSVASAGSRSGKRRGKRPGCASAPS
jgi:multidrug efflux pump subunit AcrA (membrane-fusion protein)